MPDRDILQALTAAAGRGVDVQLLLPGASNHPVMDWLAHRSFADLLQAGIRIFLYEEAMIHTKTAVIDGQWATVGTANIDRVSLAGNYEVNVEVFDPGFARMLEEASGPTGPPPVRSRSMNGATAATRPGRSRRSPDRCDTSSERARAGRRECAVALPARGPAQVSPQSAEGVVVVR